MAQEGSVDFNEIRNAYVHSLLKGASRPNSLGVAQVTINFLRKVVVQEKYENIEDLLQVLRLHLSHAVRDCPSEPVIRNVFLIVMKLAREENTRALYGVDKEVGNPYDSLNTLWKKDEDLGNVTAAGKKMRKGLIAAVKEVMSELETARDCILGRVSDVVQLNDTVITYGLSSSPTLRLFLDTARKTTKMRQVLSVSSSTDDVQIPDFASALSLRDVASVMPDVTKVVLGCVTVFPDGSCLVPSGVLSIAHLAYRHAVPLYVLVSFYKIAPYFSADAATVVQSQGKVGLPVKYASSLRHRVILSPLFDILPANLVTLYISNNDAVLPSHMYRLISDYYHPQDLTESV